MPLVRLLFFKDENIIFYLWDIYGIYTVVKKIQWKGMETLFWALR